MQVWQRKPGFWPFLKPYLQGIGDTGVVARGMAKTRAASGKNSKVRVRVGVLKCVNIITPKEIRLIFAVS